jgi:hypothetical protein
MHDLEFEDATLNARIREPVVQSMQILVAFINLARKNGGECHLPPQATSLGTSYGHYHESMIRER